MRCFLPCDGARTAGTGPGVSSIVQCNASGQRGLTRGRGADPAGVAAMWRKRPARSPASGDFVGAAGALRAMFGAMFGGLGRRERLGARMPAPQPAAGGRDGRIELGAHGVVEIRAIFGMRLRLHADQHQFARIAALELRAGERIGEIHLVQIHGVRAQVRRGVVARACAQRAGRLAKIGGIEHDHALRRLHERQERAALRAAIDALDMWRALPRRSEPFERAHAEARVAPLHIADSEHDDAPRRERARRRFRQRRMAGRKDKRKVLGEKTHAGNPI
ncbi:hypothetical protein PT2222_50067 [Paraburkholderia tropica]